MATTNKTSNHRYNRYRPKSRTKSKTKAKAKVQDQLKDQVMESIEQPIAAKKKAAKAVVNKPKQKPKQKRKPAVVIDHPFKIIPLGGLGEIGKNCTLIECDDEILMIDCGFAFPEYEMFGIDLVIPDFTYIRENMHKLKGLIITHGHEDHIGGVPYLLQEVNVPVYASPLSMGLIEHKLEENGLFCDKHVIKAGDVFSVGHFKVEALQTNHSIADALAFSVKFPGGHVVHTGDFKIDYSPLDGKVIDLNRFSQLGAEGVDVLLCDSTNVTRSGFTPSEAVVRKSIDEIFDNNDKRVIIATFASNVHRIKYIIESSIKHHRRIAISGRSMEKVMNLAKSLGYLDDIPEAALVDVSEIKNIADKNLTIITTGSQGEPMSALTRMAYDNHRSIKLKKNDVVVFSSSPIPGNEKVISQVINQLYEKEVNVVSAKTMDVHVSGHASSEELKLIHTLLRPRFFMPAHGECRHLIEHRNLAHSLGMPSDRIFVMKNGDALTISNKQAKLVEKYTSGEDVLVDGAGIGDVGTTVLKDRKSLSQSGLFTIAVAIDAATGSLMTRPEIRTRGFVYVQEHQDILDEALSIVYNTIGRCASEGITDEAALTKAIKSDVKSYIYKVTKRYPVIIPIILFV